MYFLDNNNYRIRRVDAKGIITTIAGDGQGFAAGLDTSGPALSRALAISNFIAVDPSGIVYYGGNNNVSRVTAAGSIEVVASVNLPNSIVIDPSGTPYVSSASGSIYRISSSGIVSTVVSFPPNTANYADLLSADAAGNVTALVDGQLRRYASDGTSTVLPSPGGIAESWLAMDPKGTLALAPRNSPVIQTFTGQSGLTTVAGAKPLPAPDGTPLRSAWFLNPSSIAFSRTGDLYIAESGACQIRKISAAGVLSTFGGTGNCAASVAVDSQNHVWVLDSGLLYFISQDGTRSESAKLPFSGFAPGYNQQLAVDAKDRVFILGPDFLYRVLPNLALQTVIAPPQGAGGTSAILSGLGTDSAGNVYFSASVQPPGINTYVVNDDLTYSVKYPGFYPSSIAFDPRGNIWGAGGGQITAFDTAGIPYVGLTPGFSGDGGPLQSARMSTFQSIGFGPDGNLYFIDNSTRIRRVTVTVPPAAPVISQNGIVNAANYAPGPVAPGELISIFGSNFGPSSLQIPTIQNNTLPPLLGRTRVWFILGGANGVLVRGPIVAITPNQINVVVPFEARFDPSVYVQVEVDQILSNAVSIPITATAPGLSSPILNQDGTLNSAANPAPRGSIISLYGTGLGLSSPQLGNGYLAVSTPYSMPVNPVTIAIGGQSSTVLYAGDAPTLPSGVFQVNATIPSGINSGPASVSLEIGGSSTQVIVAVK